MQLRRALGLGRNDIVAFVGAGGKTTSLERLAAELAGTGQAVVCTTTTNIWQPAGTVLVEPAPGVLLERLPALVQPGRIVTVAAGIITAEDEDTGNPARPKLVGLPAGFIAAVRDVAGVDAVLVEADGGRGRAIKAPAAHEPVIPGGASMVVTLVGVEALGQPLDDAIAHRPGLVGRLLGIEEGTPLGPGHIARLLASPAGGRKDVPPGARFVPFINKVQDEAGLRAARAIAARLRWRPGVDAVLIGAALAPDPILEVW